MRAERPPRPSAALLGRIASSILGAAVAAATLVATAATATADWKPRGIVATQAALADVLAANARASGGANPRLAQRHEHWTYLNGTRNIAVAVNVRDDDFRTSLELDGLTYTAGRIGGARWRGDGNGVVHGVEADLQGDALDRAPQAVFALDTAACALAGEAHLPAPAWVVATERDGDKPAYFYIDEASGTIVREVMRDGKRVVTTSFDRFEPLDGFVRARHWRVDDGERADDLDVTVDAIEPGAVSAADVAFPARRLFAPATPLATAVELPARFDHDRITLDVIVAGRRRSFMLDTGTTSITVDPRVATSVARTTLEHAALPDVTVGPLELDRVSVLSIPDFELDGILGLDFFFGHVIEIDYPHRRVRVLSAGAAAAAFADPKTTLLDANVDQGMPLVPAAIGTLSSNTFALDTGSPHLYVMRPFMERFAPAIAKAWTTTGRWTAETYLEGSIGLQLYHVPNFAFANTLFTDVMAGGQIPNNVTDDLDVPFDAIIGTDVLRKFDLYLDYDNARLGVRND